MIEIPELRPGLAASPNSTRGILRNNGGSGLSRCVASVVILLLFSVGVWWGLPGGYWAPDELTPDIVRDAMSHRFSGGWFDKYPPLHYYVLSAVQYPFDWVTRTGFFAADSFPSDSGILLAARLVTVAMACGVAACVYSLGLRFWNPSTGITAACLAAAFLPMPFYAKLANLDVPYVFWFSVALVFYARLLHQITRRDLVLCAIAATLSVCTKDQAYGLFVLPGCHIFFKALASRTGGRRRALIDMGLAFVAAVATFVISHNLIFNAAGFADHVRALVGPASVDYRMFSSTPSGQVELAVATSDLLSWMLGWAGVALVAIGVVHAIRTRSPVLWLLLPILSYYLFFIAVVGYVYDRFLLPATVILALFAGASVVRAFESRSTILRLAAGVAVAWIMWRGLSVDVLLVLDSRYSIEKWLAARSSTGASIAWVGQPLYLPRLPEESYSLEPSIEATLEAGPELIVVNAEYATRYHDQPERQAWWQWLESGASPYRAVVRKKTRVWWSALSYDIRFYDSREDWFTNLDKANPEIVIFHRFRTAK